MAGQNTIMAGQNKKKICLKLNRHESKFSCKAKIIRYLIFETTSKSLIRVLYCKIDNFILIYFSNC